MASLINNIGRKQTQQTMPQTQSTEPRVNNISAQFGLPTRSQPTAYQSNLYQPTQTNKWYSGDTPTELEVLGRIGKIYQQDQARGQKLMSDYRKLQSDPTSAFWNPYLNPTNRSVSNLASLGLDTSNLSDEWFEQNRWLRGHYLYNGTTNAPSKPGKDATPTQLAAYEYHQLEKAWDDTKNAQSEWAALQDELRYMATLPDRNYSDDDIVERIDWKKYPTLAKMDSTRNAGEPMELNSAIGYSRAALYGTIWAARNDGGSGDPLSDIIYSASGAGVQYKANPEIRDKLDPESDKWSPFSVGSTMEDARLYFGVTEFNQKWLDEHKYILSGTDQHAIDMYQKVAAAEEHMVVLEDQLAAMYKDIDEMIGYGYDEDYIIDTVFGDTGSYGELFKLDKSMKSGVLGNGLVDTTRAIDYRRADVEDYIHRESHMQDGLYVPDVVINDNVVLAYTEGRKSRLQDQVTPEPVNAPASETPAPTQASVSTPATEAPEFTSENVNAPGETPETTEKPVNRVGSNTAGSTSGSVNAKGEKAESGSNLVSSQDASASNAKSAYTESQSSLGVKDREADIEKAKHQRKNLSMLSPAIHNKGTAAEKTAFSTTNTPDFSAMATGLSGILIGADMARESIEVNLGETAARDYLPAIKAVREYEGIEKSISDNKEYLEYAKEELAALESRYEASGRVSAGERYGITELLNSNEADDIRAALESDYDEEKWDAVEKIFNIEYPDSSFTDAAREVFGGTIEGEPSVEDFISAYPRVQTGIDHFLNGIPDELVANFRLSDEEMKLMDAWRETIEQVEGAIDADEEKLASMNGSYMQAINTRNAIINDYNVARNLFGEDINTELLDRYEVWADAAGNWNPYPFTGVSPWDESLYKWDQALQNGEDTSDLYSPETLEKYAADTIEDASRRLHFLKVMKDNMDAYGLSPSDEELRNVDQSIETLQKELADAQLFYVSRLPEFDDKVKEGKEMSLDGMSDLTKKNVEFMLHGYKAESLEGGVSSLWSAITGQYSSDPFLDQFFSSSPQDASEFRLREGYIVNYYNAMTQTEKDRYFYLLREEGEQAANDYLKSQMNDTNGTIPRRVSEDITSSWNAYAKSGTGQSIVAELGAFVTNVIGGVENMRNNIRHWGDKNVDPKGIGYVTSEATDALRQGVIENLQSNVSGEEAKEFISVVMNSINSAGDSMINSWLAGGAISAIGESVPALAKAYNWLKSAQAGEYGRLLKFGANALENFSSAVPMGLQAADKAVREARANGANPDQESKIWTVTFLAETLTEAITVGNIRDMWQKGAKGEVVSLFKDYVFNGIEEAVGEGINQYWEENAETLIMGALSEREQYVSALKANGVPLTIAEKMADERMWKNVAIAAASGFLSSGVSQTVSNVIGSVQGAGTAKGIDNMRKSNIALLSEVDTQSSGKSTAVSLSAVLQDDNVGKKQSNNTKSHQSDIAAQWFISNVNNGSSLNAKRSMTGLLSASGNNILAVKEAVTFGSLTSGNTNAVLRDISNTVANGGAVTEENVNELLQAVEEDKTGDRADVLADEFNSSVLTGMIANRVMEIIANDDAVAEKIKNSQQSVRDAQSHLESRTEHKEEADAKVEAVAGNVQTAVTEQLENTTAAGNAPVEQNLKQLEGAVEQQAQAELEQQQAEAQLEQAKADADNAEDDTMNAVRQQAQAEVTQQLADEAQQEQDEFQQSIDYYHPVKPFSKPVTIAKEDGTGSVQLTGVYAIMPDGQYVYSTPNGYITDNELDVWEDKDLPILDSAMEGWKNGDNPVAPAAWMSHSLKAKVKSTGKEVDLIGFVGKYDGFMQVFMDSNGDVYTIEELKMEPDPFTGDNGNQAALEAFDEAGGENLPDYTPQPSAEMPEGFVAYPGGPQEITMYQGNDAEQVTVVGVLSGEESPVGSMYYVLEDGKAVPAALFADESSEFFGWAASQTTDFSDLDIDDFDGSEEDFDISEDEVDSILNGDSMIHLEPDNTTYGADEPGYKAPPGAYAMITFSSETGPEQVDILGLYHLGNDMIYRLSYNGQLFVRDANNVDLSNSDQATKNWADLASFGLLHSGDGSTITVGGHTYYFGSQQGISLGTPLGEGQQQLMPSIVNGYDGFFAPEGAEGTITLGIGTGEKVSIKGLYKVGGDYLFRIEDNDGSTFWKDIDLMDVEGETKSWVNAALVGFGQEPAQSTNENVLPNQSDVDAAFEDSAVTEMEQQVGVPTQGKVNKETGEPLKDWQDPKYHGKVVATKPKTNPKSAKFKAWQGLENIPEELRRFFVNPDGTPKIYYRGYDRYLYIKHQSHPMFDGEGKKVNVNFYMDKLSTAITYADGHNEKVVLRPIKNWETAKAAMQDIHMNLVEAADPNGSGKMGYQVTDQSGSPYGATKKNGWFAENELALFRDTYGGTPKNKGIFVGFLTAKNPLYIYGNEQNYDNIYASVTAPDGAHLSATQRTRLWAEWAFSHGYDAVIFDQIKDNASGYGGEVGVEIVTANSSQFKSVYNDGTWSKTNPNIMALKTTGKPLPLSAIEKAMGRRLSNEFYDVTDRLNKGEKVSYEEIMELPEIQWVESRMKKGDSLDYGTYNILKKATDAQSLADAGIPEETIRVFNEKGAIAAIESLFTAERVNEQHEIIQKILDTGSAVIDENGKVQYTGEVEQGHRVDVLIGLPASGKSTIADYISRLYKSRLIDNDDVKALFSDFNRGLNSNYLHNESRFVHDQILGQAARRGDNIILPVVGHSFSSVAKQIALLKAKGYNVHLHMTDLAQSKAVGRSLNRMISPDSIRYLPPSYLMGVDPGNISATYDRLVKEGLVNANTKWNTDIPKGANPVLIESSDIGDAGLFSGRGSVGNDISGGVQKGSGIQELKVSTPLTPTQRQANKAKTKLKSPQDIAQRLAKDLGHALYATNRFGDLSASIRGFWDTHGKYLALRAKEIGNLNVAFHELGHGIADTLKMTGTQQMVDNMIAANPDFATEYSVDQLQDEAFAEFMWRYLLDDQAAKDFAGEAFVNAFEQRLLANQKMYKAVKRAQTALHEWSNATDDERLASTIKYEKSGSRPTFHQFTQNAVSLLADKSVAAEDITQLMRDATGKDLPISQNLRAMALLSNHSQKQAVNMLTDNLTDADGTIIGDGLGKMLEAVGFKGTEENIHALERYMLAKHSVKRDEQGKPVFAEGVFSSKESRDAYIRRIETTRHDLVDAAKAWQTFRHNFLQAWMVDTGYWSQEFLDTLEKTYPHYVPTFRVGGNVDSMNGVGGKKGRGYTLRAAVGGSQNIYSPFYSFVGMVNQITSMVNLNRTARVFDNIYQTHEGLGYWARLLPEAPMETQLLPNGTTLNERQQQLFDLLSSEINEDLMEQVLNITKSRPGQRNTDGPSNILTVQREDGTAVRYQFTEDGAELFKLLAGVQEKTNIKALDILGKMTRTMSMLTTGSNPLFAMRNAARDFQTSVNYGSWASNYLTGARKWMRAFAEVARGKSDLYQSYKALGGGGWTYIDQGSRKSMKEIESEIFGDDKSTVGKTAKWLGKKLWNTVTLARLNEIIEQTSRFAEYKYGKHDTNTVEGRQEAFLAAQDATVDFSRNGNSELAFVLKKLVPFFNASTQGVYRTARQFTRGERDRAGVRLAKTVINTALASAIASGLILKYGDDDDKDEFANILSSGIKANHLILPNPMKDKPGEPPFIRIPLAQDPLGYAVHGVVTNAMWNGSADETAVSLAATADVILDNLNPLGSGTIMQPIIDVSHNRTWFGGSIIRNGMIDWTDPAGQYNEDTPEVFRTLGRLIGVSPEIVEYIVSQYTGFIGATATPALTIDKNGEIGGLGAILDSIKKKWTADPYSSNDVTQRFFNMKEDLKTIKDEARDEKPQGLLLRSLTQDDVNNAYAEAEGMLSSKGLVGATSEFISDSYKKIDAVNANDTLSDEEKLVQVREIKREMVRVVEAANQELDAYRKKYITGETLTDRALGALEKRIYEGPYAHVPTPEEKISQTFQDDFEEPYMQKALSVFNGSGSGAGKSAALPHPSYSFTIKDQRGNEVECEITPDEVDMYDKVYKDTYTEYLRDDSKIRKDRKPWDTMTEEEQYNRLKNAHSAANKAVRDQYAKDHGIN